jgi:hypothetical protein
MEHRRTEIDKTIRTLKDFLRRDREFFPTKFSEFCQTALTYIAGMEKDEAVKKSLFLTTTPEAPPPKEEQVTYEPVTIKEEDDDIDIQANAFRINSRSSVGTAFKAPRKTSH